MRVRRLILQTTTSQGTFGKSLAIIRRTSCWGVSAWSMSIMLAGEDAATCRTISMPMEPADPVMSTFFPDSCSSTDFMSTRISCRGRRSSTLTSFSCTSSWISPLRMADSVALCTMKIFTPLLMKMSCIFWLARKSLSRYGEMRTAWMRSLSITSSRLSSRLYTFRPRSFRFLILFSWDRKQRMSNLTGRCERTFLARPTPPDRAP